jgi:hypothetical protein
LIEQETCQFKKDYLVFLIENLHKYEKTPKKLLPIKLIKILRKYLLEKAA